MLSWVFWEANAKAGLNASILLEQIPVGKKGWGEARDREGGRGKWDCAVLSPVRERAREGWGKCPRLPCKVVMSPALCKCIGVHLPVEYCFINFRKRQSFLWGRVVEVEWVHYRVGVLRVFQVLQWRKLSKESKSVWGNTWMSSVSLELNIYH